MSSITTKEFVAESCTLALESIKVKSEDNSDDYANKGLAAFRCKKLWHLCHKRGENETVSRHEKLVALKLGLRVDHRPGDTPVLYDIRISNWIHRCVGSITIASEDLKNKYLCAEGGGLVLGRVGKQRRWSMVVCMDVSTGLHRWECGKKGLYINVTG